MSDTVRAAKPARSLPVAVIAALRPKQWLKNVLVFAAPLAAGSLFEPDVLVPTIWAFIAFCFISSATYLVNDTRDRHADAAHPTKRFRPIAAGELPAKLAAALAVVLAAAAFAIGLLVAPALALVIAIYAAVQLSYSFGLKHEPVVELVLLALGFLLRAIAGAAASGLPISQWFLIVAGFGSLFMAAGKRTSELVRTMDDPSAVRRRSLDGYALPYLRFVWGTAAAVTITAYCLWAFEVAGREGTAAWATEASIVPFVLGILRYAMDIDRGEAEAPEDIVTRDRSLMGIGLLWVVLFGMGTLGIGA